MSVDLDDILSLPIGSARGRRATPLAMSFARELNASDVELLHNPPAQGLTASPLKALRHTHHLLAQLLANGVKHVECAHITGYSSSRISILLGDPAFSELVEYYRGQKEQIYLDVHERLAKLGVNTIEELQQRLLDEPDSWSKRELMELAELTLDRSVAPPKGGRAVPSGGNAVSVNVSFVSPAPATPGLTIDATAVVIDETDG